MTVETSCHTFPGASPLPGTFASNTPSPAIAVSIMKSFSSLSLRYRKGDYDAFVVVSDKACH